MVRPRPSWSGSPRRPAAPCSLSSSHPDGRTLGMLIQGEHAVRLWDLDRMRSRLAELGLDWE